VARRMAAASRSTKRLEEQARSAEADADRIRSVIRHLETVSELSGDGDEPAQQAR
jgi:hypothetical protein